MFVVVFVGAHVVVRINCPMIVVVVVRINHPTIVVVVLGSNCPVSKKEALFFLSETEMSCFASVAGPLRTVGLLARFCLSDAATASFETTSWAEADTPRRPMSLDFVRDVTSPRNLRSSWRCATVGLLAPFCLSDAATASFERPSSTEADAPRR